MKRSHLPELSRDWREYAFRKNGHPILRTFALADGDDALAMSTSLTRSAKYSPMRSPEPYSMVATRRAVPLISASTAATSARVKTSGKR